MTDSEELPNGYALRFPAKPFLFLRIARWIELERACCPVPDDSARDRADRTVLPRAS